LALNRSGTLSLYEPTFLCPQLGRTQVVISHHNPILKTFADRLRAAGKPHKVVITAVARKLVTIANALCKNRQKWADQAT